MKTRNSISLVPNEARQLSNFFEARDNYLRALKQRKKGVASEALYVWIITCATIPQLLQPLGFVAFNSDEHVCILSIWNRLIEKQFENVKSLQDARKIAHSTPVYLKNWAWSLIELNTWGFNEN